MFKFILDKFVSKFLFLVLTSIFFFGAGQVKAFDGPIYIDGLGSGWSNWSWSASVNFDNPTPTKSGPKSIWAQLFSWGAVYFHTETPIDLNNYTNLKFSLQPSQDNQKLQVIIYGDNDRAVKTLPFSSIGGDPKAGFYNDYTIPVSLIGTRYIKGVAIQDAIGQNQPPIFMDSLYLESGTIATTPSVTPTLAPTAILTPTPTPVNSTAASFNIFTDALNSSWSNWSWGANVAFSSVITFSPYSAWAGLYLHSDNGVDTTAFSAISFSAKAAAANTKYSLALYGIDSQALSSFLPLDKYGGVLSNNSWITYTIPLSDLNASSKTIKGLVMQESLGFAQPAIYIDNIRLISTPAPTNTVSPSLVGFTTSNNSIYKNGIKINLKGVNWFGFETETYVPHGLWARNWREMISQIKNIGFNSVRIPVCPATLRSMPVSSIDYSKNSDLQGLNSLQILDKFMDEFKNQGIYVLLDHHRPDCLSISDLWYTGSYSEAQWIADLQFMAQRYIALPNFLGIDLKNEPHGSATWGTGNTGTDWNSAAERAGQAVLASNPNILIFVEGIGQSGHCSDNIGFFWGQNLQVQRCKPISTAAIPAGKLILSPHIYGPDVSWQGYFGDGNFPKNMPSIWDAQFGYLTNSGFTIVPGEWGGKYGTAGGNSSDTILQDTLVSYMKSKSICSSFYWSWNPNSSDTGGVLQDNWLTPWPSKVTLLQNYFQGCN